MGRNKKSKDGSTATAPPLTQTLDDIPDAMTGVTTTAGTTVDASVIAASVAAATRSRKKTTQSDAPFDSNAALLNDGVPAPSYMKLNKAKLDEILVLNPVSKYGNFSKRIKVGVAYGEGEVDAFGGRYNGTSNGERCQGDRWSFWGPWIKATPKMKEMRDQKTNVLQRKWTLRLGVNPCYDYVSLKRVNFHEWMVETLHAAVIDKLCANKTKYGLSESDTRVDIERMFGKNDAGPVKNTAGGPQVKVELETNASYLTPKGTSTDETNTSIDQITPYILISRFDVGADGDEKIDPRTIFGKLATDNKTGEPLVSRFDGLPYMVTHDDLRDYDYVRPRIRLEAISLWSNDEKLSYKFVLEQLQVATEAQLLARNRILLPVSSVTAGDDDDDVYASIIDELAANGDLDDAFGVVNTASSMVGVAATTTTSQTETAPSLDHDDDHVFEGDEPPAKRQKLA